MAKQTLQEKVAKAMAKYPDRSQSKVGDPLLVMKLFHAYGAGTWYLIEYNAQTSVAFCYVTGLGFNELGYADINELAALKMGPVPRIEVDKHYKPIRRSALIEID